MRTPPAGRRYSNATSWHVESPRRRDVRATCLQDSHHADVLRRRVPINAPRKASAIQSIRPPPPPPLPVLPPLLPPPPLAALKVAATDAAALIVTEQLALAPLHAPDHPANVLPALAVAVSVTTALGSNALEHVDPQAIPLGLDATDPAPDTDTVSIGRTVNWALTPLAASSVTEHVDPEPEHAPDHPVNADDACGAAVNTTDVPETNP